MGVYWIGVRFRRWVMSGSEQVALNGSEVWAYVVELDGGLRMRLEPRLGVGAGHGEDRVRGVPGEVRVLGEDAARADVEQFAGGPARHRRPDLQARACLELRHPVVERGGHGRAV